MVLRGDFIFEDVKSALDDDGFSESAHLDVSLWSKSRGGRSVALVGDGVIVLGEDDRIREAIEVLVEGTGSIDEEEEVGDIVRALGETVLYMVDTRCDYRRCSVWGVGVQVERRDTVAAYAYMFRDEEAADDARHDVEDDLGDALDDVGGEVSGALLLVRGFVDDDRIDIDRRSGVLSFIEEDDAPVASVAVAAPIATPRTARRPRHRRRQLQRLWQPPLRLFRRWPSRRLPPPQHQGQRRRSCRPLLIPTSPTMPSLYCPLAIFPASRPITSRRARDSSTSRVTCGRRRRLSTTAGTSPGGSRCRVKVTVRARPLH